MTFRSEGVATSAVACSKDDLHVLALLLLLPSQTVWRGSIGICLRQNVISSRMYDRWLTALSSTQTSLWTLPTAFWMNVPLGGWALVFVFDLHPVKTSQLFENVKYLRKYLPKHFYDSIYSFYIFYNTWFKWLFTRFRNCRASQVIFLTCNIHLVGLNRLSMDILVLQILLLYLQITIPFLKHKTPDWWSIVPIFQTALSFYSLYICNCLIENKLKPFRNVFQVGAFKCYRVQASSTALENSKGLKC